MADAPPDQQIVNPGNNTKVGNFGDSTHDPGGIDMILSCPLGHG